MTGLIVPPLLLALLRHFFLVFQLHFFTNLFSLLSFSQIDTESALLKLEESEGPFPKQELVVTRLVVLTVSRPILDRTASPFSLPKSE